MGLKRSDVSVHVITAGESIPVEFLVTASSIPDKTTFQVMDINLPKNGDLYDDVAYINQQHKDVLLHFNQIRIKAATKKTQS